MVEPEKTTSTDLESTVRHLREENAKLMQLLRAQGLLPDVPLCSTNKSSDPQSSTFSQTSESSSVTFDHSDHQFVNNSSSIHHQQNYHGNSSTLTPNFNTVIQNSTQPFVQNNTNLIQPINLVNINNVSLESIQSIFSGQNNLVYLSQSSSNSSTTTTTTTTTSCSSSSSLSTSSTSTSSTSSSNSNSTCSTSSSSSSSSSSSTLSTVQEATTFPSDSHQISIRPKPSLLHPHQELVPVVPKIRAEQYESITRQYSSSSITNETSNLLDNDSNDPKQKFPRPIRPKPSSRSNSLQIYKSMMINETNSNPSPTVSLFSSSTCSSPTSTSNHFVEQQHSSMIDETSISSSMSNGNSKKSSNNSSNKNRLRNRNKTSTNNNSTPVPIAPNFVAGRPLAPAPVNVQRSITSNNPITKRSNTSKKRPNKSLVQCHSESLLSNVSSPTNSFADSISGFLENFNQELLKSNILSQDSQTTNLLTDEPTTTTSTTTNSMRTSTLDNIDLRHLVNGAIQRHESFQSTLDEFPSEQNSTTNPNETEPIGPFMSDEDMRFVEMNFDENTFLKQFDLDDPSLRLNVQHDQNLFANILTNANSHSQIEFVPTEHQQVTTVATTTTTTTHSLAPTPSMYSGSSLINNNVFTTVVPLGSQQHSSISSSSQIKTTIINQTNVSTFLPEEGVQLTARHIEPRQVATYESVKYQDILDELVMVTDQDALQHAQAAAANDPSMVSTDFTYALIEATNEIIKDSNLQVLQATTGDVTAATANFNDLQYFYPIEQEQELLQKQLETCGDKSNDVEQNPIESIVILEKLQTEILVSADLTKTVLDDSLIQTAITDLSSLLQLEPNETLPPEISQTLTTIEEIPIHKSPSPPPPPPPAPIEPEPIPPVQDSQPIDFDAFFSSEPSPPKIVETEMNTSFTDNFMLPANSVVVQQEEIQESIPLPIEPVGTVAPKPCILFEPILSPTNSTSPIKPNDEEMIIDEGSIGHFNPNESTTSLNENQFEALLNGEIYHPDPYAMIESPQPIVPIEPPVEDDEQEQDEPMIEHPKFVPTFEYTFNRYRDKHRLKIKRENEIRMKKAAEQSLTVPPVKLKLNTIFLQKSSQKKKKRRSKSPPTTSISHLPAETEPITPSPPSIKEPIDEKPIDRPSLKITIRTKLPLPPVQPPPIPKITLPILPPQPLQQQQQQEDPKKIRKNKKKKPPSTTQQPKKKTTNPLVEHVETEYAGLTRFERPLAQLYHQTRPPTPDESQLKHEIQTPSPPVTSIPSNDFNPIQLNPHPHSGFMIDEQTPPSSITSIEHKNSPPPLLSSQTVNEKLKLNYSHLFTYDHQHHEQQNNNTFITPPPETDFHPQQPQLQQQQQQQKNPSFDNFFPFATSPSKKRHQSRKSSVTSSTSSKSLPTTEYAIDSQALEPVSPTPLSTCSSLTMTSKSKHSASSSSASTTPTPSISSSSSTIVSTTNFNEIPSQFFDSHSHSSKSSKDSHSSHKKSSSSANRSSKTNSSQSSYQTSRSLSNHSYRTNSDSSSSSSSVLPPMLPPSMGSNPSSLHLDPYAQSYHHFAPRASAASFFNFPFPHPFLNPHAAPAPPAHFHPHHSMKYHPAAHHSHHTYPTHQSNYPYHPHLPRQQQYNNSNYMSSRDHHHHPFER